MALHPIMFYLRRSSYQAFPGFNPCRIALFREGEQVGRRPHALSNVQAPPPPAIPQLWIRV